MPKSDKVGKILLIVDSSLFIIERLERILNEANVVGKIFTATHYAEAVAVMDKTSAKLVLLDIQLPHKNGIDLLKYIVQHFPDTHVIVISNLSSDYYQKLCKRIGAFDFIDKSRDFNRITEVISSI